jgi:hypothetical protein
VRTTAKREGIIYQASKCYLGGSLVCLSVQDRRWGGRRPRWISKNTKDPVFCECFTPFGQVFSDKDHCEIRSEEAKTADGTSLDCISLDDPQFAPPHEKIEWDLLVPPGFAGTEESLRDWDTHATYNDKDFPKVRVSWSA